MDFVNGFFALDASLREPSLILDQIFLLELDSEGMVEGKEHADLGRLSRRDQSEWLLYSPACNVVDVICGGYSGPTLWCITSQHGWASAGHVQSYLIGLITKF